MDWGELCGAPGVRVGSVSAKSTIVLKELLNMSHAISVLVPAPEPIIIRAMMKDIFKRVLPA